MLIRAPRLLLCFIYCATIYGCTSVSQKSQTNSAQSDVAHNVSVTKTPIKFEKSEVNPSLGADAQTHWFFHCIPKFQHDTVEEVVKPDRAQISIRITKAELQIGLTIKQIMGREDMPKLREHERGHVQICEHLYGAADRHARTALEGIIGQIFSGVGKDRPEALRKALISASESVCNKYSDATAVRAEKMSAEYDRVTNHGGNQTPSAQAVESVLKSGTTDRP